MFKKIFDWIGKSFSCVRNGAEKIMVGVSKVAALEVVNKFCSILHWFFSHACVDYQILANWFATASVALFVGAILSKDSWALFALILCSVFFLVVSLICKKLLNEKESKK